MVKRYLRVSGWTENDCAYVHPVTLEEIGVIDGEYIKLIAKAEVKTIKTISKDIDRYKIKLPRKEFSFINIGDEVRVIKGYQDISPELPSETKSATTTSEKSIEDICRDVKEHTVEFYLCEHFKSSIRGENLLRYPSFESFEGMDDFITYLKKQYRMSWISPKISSRVISFFGVPGCGKTTLLQAFLRYIYEDLDDENKKNFSVTVQSDLDVAWKGDTANNVEALFRFLQDYPPKAAFIDEVDSVLSPKTRDDRELVNLFKKHLSEFSGRDVFSFFLGTTNEPWRIREAAGLRRRIQWVYVPLPRFDYTGAIFRRVCNNYTNNRMNDFFDIKMDEMISKLKGYSPSDIKSIVLTTIINGLENANIITSEGIQEIKKLKRSLKTPENSYDLLTLSLEKMVEKQGKNQTDNVLEVINNHPKTVYPADIVSMILFNHSCEIGRDLKVDTYSKIIIDTIGEIRRDRQLFNLIDQSLPLMLNIVSELWNYWNYDDFKEWFRKFAMNFSDKTLTQLSDNVDDKTLLSIITEVSKLNKYQFPQR